MKTPTRIKTRDDFETIVEEAAKLRNRIETRAAEQSERLTQMQEAYKAELQPHKDRLDTLVETAAAWAEDNGDKLFVAGKRSGETPVAKYGFRKASSVVLLPNWTVAKAIEAIKTLKWKRFLKIEEKIQLTVIKKELTPDQMAQIGYTVEHTETFWIKPAHEESSHAKN